jgi:Putative beta-barrel porin-2, OmpL-like. bbp2
MPTHWIRKPLFQLHFSDTNPGIFVSYVGLFSYHNFDNWAYQPSYVSSNTPWFFNGVRVQWFPTHHLKIEPWFINGWQAYNRFNGHPGIGGQLKWTPKPWLEIIGNQYGVGNDNIGLRHRGRYHTDDSVEIKYYDNADKITGLDKVAFTFTGDLGCETGDGVTCHGGKGGPKQAFLGWMAYNRFWFNKDKYAVTLGGGSINNPGRYLTLVLPVNGADAISGTPYFPAAPGTKFKAWDTTATFDYMPKQYFTFRTEFGYRHANVPYWSGRGGITPPGGNNGSPANFVCSSGASSGQTDLVAAEAACGGGRSSVWFPDLRKGQGLLMFSFLVKF